MGGNRDIAERFIASLEARDWEAWAALLHPDGVSGREHLVERW